MTQTLLRSPLHERHLALGATFAPFAGWHLPLQYPGGGVTAEHTAVRQGVAVFDVSHLGKVTVRGPGAADLVNVCLTNDLRRIAPGQAQYTLCCDDTGGVVDDIIAYLYAEDDVFLVPNAANAEEVARRLRTAAPPAVTIADEHTAHAILAVQGPRSAEVLTRLGLPTDHAYLSFVTAHAGVGAGGAVTVCRTGYTGELGYELVVAAERAGQLWDALFEAGAPLGLRAAGLAARDTLRTEMGYPLHGQDLTVEVTPVQARLGWAVGWSKPAFWGRAALLAERQAGPRRLLWGIEALDRGIPRAGMAVLKDGRPAGRTTSGTFSPTRRIGIALALLDTSAGLAAEDLVDVDIRGRLTTMRLVKPPFVPSSVRAS